MAAPGYAETAFRNGYEFTQGKGYVLPEYPFVEPPEIRSGQVGQHPIVIIGAGLAGLTDADIPKDWAGLETVAIDVGDPAVSALVQGHDAVLEDHLGRLPA